MVKKKITLIDLHNIIIRSLSHESFCLWTLKTLNTAYSDKIRHLDSVNRAAQFQQELFVFKAQHIYQIEFPFFKKY